MISIIIPTYNEELNISKAIFHAKKAKSEKEIIVIDGNSTDDTVKKAKISGANLVLIGEKSRGKQLNYGASVAKGDILLFLHADTILPDEYDVEIREIIYSKGYNIGAFKIKIDSKKIMGIKIIEYFINIRTLFFKLPFGDQAIFTEKKIFEEMGGFKPIPLMEDFEFVTRIKKKYPISITNKYVTTSGRRWEKKGIFTTTLINQLCIFTFSIGLFSPERISKIYYNN